MSVSFMRHSGFVGPDDCNHLTLNIIGVGATGSMIAMIAARMGWHRFRIWDLDVVESHNLPNQIYNYNHIGQKKVDALEDVLTSFNPDILVEKHPYFFETEKHKDLLDGPLVLTVDSLSARKDIYDSFYMNINVPLVIETAMGFTHAWIRAFLMEDLDEMQSWYSNLKDDSEVGEGPCGERIMTTLTLNVASIATQLLFNYISNASRNTERQIPNKILVSGDTFQNNTFS